jgi:hypothetical protein
MSSNEKVTAVKKKRRNGLSAGRDKRANHGLLLTNIEQLQAGLNILTEKVLGLECRMETALERLVEVLEALLSLEERLDATTLTGSRRPPRYRSSHRVRAGQSMELMTSQPPRVTADQTVLFNTAHRQAECSEEGGEEDALCESGKVTGTSQVITLNSEDDYPGGSWLGDPHNQHQRVRTFLSPEDLAGLEQACPGPEKLALGLLDTCFSRKTLAQSNLSGKGRHKKKQLDPLVVYGIYCHLKYLYNIREPDWNRIKNNMESKCRFLWKRKLKNLPLGESKPPQAASTDNCGILVYPLYQVDGHQIIQVMSQGEDNVVVPVTSMLNMHQAVHPQLEAEVVGLELLDREEGMEECQQEQRGEELVGPPDLANRGLVMADLGEVISISEDAEGLMVASQGGEILFSTEQSS